MTDDQNRELLRLMNILIDALERLQEQPYLRQIRLETQWLRQNLQDGHLTVPTTWELLIYRPPTELKRHSEAALAVRKLADALRKYSIGVPSTQNERLR
ncbi:MAG TPA: hypothetical protein V6C69_02375 [Trichormus sp.]|jgi:hypothetical protein